MKRNFVLSAICTLGAFALLSPGSSRADEGMWTYNNFPTAAFKAKYGWAPDDKWLDHVRLSSARLAGGCSASFVSESGLIMTNHHCAHSCIQQLSTKDKDFVASGFYAKAPTDEVKCPEIEINQLVEIKDVTERIQAATKGLSDEKYNDAIKVAQAAVEKECSTSDKVRCDVVSLYHGGLYNLYKYKRYQDVRLVFAPEFPIAFFGGDPDNFNFPRYDLDVSFIRVYEDDKPAKMDHWLKWSPAGAKEGDLTFVSGHPGGTSRLLTMAELEAVRDVELPDALINLAQWRGELTQYQMRSPEAKRTSEAQLFGVENSFKALKGRWAQLLDKQFMDAKLAAEKDLRARIAKDPEKQKTYGDAWDQIAKAHAAEKEIRLPLRYLEGGQLSGRARLYGVARTLVRAAAELAKPNDKRFPEYRDAGLPAVKQRLFSAAPFYDDLEIEQLRFGLTKFREDLGADHPAVKRILGKDSPEDIARRLVSTTTLKDPAARKALFDGGQKAIDASKDSLILFYKGIDPDARAIRKKFEDTIEAAEKKNDELIAKARFAMDGTSTYPDATFTLRLSFGQLKGYEENGRTIKPLTTMGGAFERATGRDPFALPASWLAAKSKLNLATPFNMATTNDIIGGNSGSPVVDKDGQVVGLIFDGNIQSLGGDYGYDAKQNRAVAVTSQALLEALDKIYGADRIVKELRPISATPAKKSK